MIPDNPFASLSQAHALQILVFAVLFGLAINLSQEKGQPLIIFFHSLSNVMYELIGMIMRLAPYGIGAIMAWVAGTFGWQVLTSLFQFICTIYLASFLHIAIVYGGMLLLTGLNPWRFFKGVREAIVFAFTSSSSSATLPTSLVCAQKNLGVPSHIAHFVLPLGATINMNGTALFHAISALFIAQAYSIPLNLSHYVTITLVATLCSIGTAGAPGSGLIVLGTVLASIGLPAEGLALIWGIDRIRDMIGTVVNILGDLIVSVALAQREKELDLNIYNAKDTQ